MIMLFGMLVCRWTFNGYPVCSMLLTDFDFSRRLLSRPIWRTCARGNWTISWCRVILVASSRACTARATKTLPPKCLRPMCRPRPSFELLVLLPLYAALLRS